MGCRGVWGVWVFGICEEFMELIEGGIEKRKAPPHGIIPTN